MMSKYSNGYGHLAVTIAVFAALTLLRFFDKIDVTSMVAISGPVVAFWFMSGAANRFQARPDVSAEYAPAAPPAGPLPAAPAAPPAAPPAAQS